MMGKAPVPFRGTREGDRARTGLGLVDAMIAMVILTVAVGGLSGAVVHATRLNQVNQETALADAALLEQAERMQGLPFDAIFATYMAAPSFDVPGLAPTADDVDGRVGRISFPTVGGQLREDVEDASLGMPRDLNGDGLPPDSLDHSGDYVILPATIRVEWTGTSGDRVLEYDLVLVR